MTSKCINMSFSDNSIVWINRISPFIKKTPPHNFFLSLLRLFYLEYIMLVNNSLMSLIPDLLQDPPLQVSQGNSAWGGSAPLQLNKLQVWSTICCLLLCFFWAQSTGRNCFLCCHGGKAPFLQQASFEIIDLCYSPVASAVISNWSGSSERGKGWAQPAESLLCPHRSPVPGDTPALSPASRDKDMSSYTQYITLKSLQIIKCDASLGHYYSHFNISQSKFFWNIHRFRHSLKFVCNSKVPCLHIIPK